MTNVEQADSKAQAQPGIGRRGFLSLGVGAAAGLLAGCASTPALGSWDAGQVAHLIPTASHDRLLIKASFKAPLARTPQLLVDGRPVAGTRTDLEGRFWRFDARELRAATRDATRPRSGQARRTAATLSR